MVAVPTPLHLAAGLLGVAAAVGLAAALLEGVGGPQEGRGRMLRLAGVGGALLHALGLALEAAFVGDPELAAWVQALGLVALAVGITPAGLVTLGSLPVLVVPPDPAAGYVGAAAAAVAALRVLVGGVALLPVGAGLLVLGVGQAVDTGFPVAADWCGVVGSLLVGGGLWWASARRILTRLLTAFIAAIVAVVILVAAVLSTVATAEIVTRELDALAAFAGQLAGDVEGWPQAAVDATSALARAPDQLLQPLDAAEAAEVFEVGFRDQDFYLVLDAASAELTRFPADLSEAFALTLAGDTRIAEVAAGRRLEDGGLVTAGGRIAAFGAVALRPAGVRPEDPPAGVLVAGRFADEVWAAQQAARLGVGVIGEVAGPPAFAAGTDVVGAEVARALAADDRAALTVDEVEVYAAAATIADPSAGAPLGRVVTTASPAVIAEVERDEVRELYLVGLTGALVTTLASAWVVRRFVRPIRQLTAAAAAVGGGDLTARAGVTTRDEVGVLARTFDEMVASLERQRRELAASAEADRRLRARVEAITSSISEALVVVDPTGMIATVNPAAETLLATPAARLVGQPAAAALVSRPLGGGPPTPLTDDPRSPRVTASRALLACGDRRWLPVAVTAAPVRDSAGRVLGRVHVIRDVSRETELEQMKSSFLANVSHELRTPLTPIKGYANILARRDVGPDASRRYAAEILAASGRLERIVGLIVDFAALDSGRVELTRERLDLAQLVRDVLVRWQAEHAARAFHVEADGQVPPVLGDPAYLRRLVDELVDNAVKFSPNGEPVTVAVTRDGPRVRLAVSDRGVGMDPDRAATIFAEFQQLDGTETRLFGGLGLGLALVKRIVDGMGADATISSAPGEGATVAVLLDPAPLLPPPPPRAHAELPAANGDGVRPSPPVAVPPPPRR